MTANASLREDLARLALFAGLDAAAIDAVVGGGREVAVAQGARAVRRGEAGSGLWVILEGDAVVVLGDEELGVLPTGSFFGEISCLLREPVVADVVARSPLRCLVIDPDDVQPLLLRHPAVMLELLKTEARRLKTTDESRA